MQPSTKIFRILVGLRASNNGLTGPNGIGQIAHKTRPARRREYQVQDWIPASRPTAPGRGGLRALSRARGRRLPGPAHSVGAATTPTRRVSGISPDRAAHQTTSLPPPRQVTGGRGGRAVLAGGRWRGQHQSVDHGLTVAPFPMAHIGKAAPATLSRPRSCGKALPRPRRNSHSPYLCGLRGGCYRCEGETGLG